MSDQAPPLRTELLSPEQVDEIRDENLPGDARYEDVLALCDTVDALQAELGVWESIGERVKDGWEIIAGHRWWRKGEHPAPVTVDQQRVLYPLPKGYVE